MLEWALKCREENIMKQTRRDSIFASVTIIVVAALLVASSASAMEWEKGQRKWSGSVAVGSTFNGSASFRLIGAYWLPSCLKLWEHGAGYLRIELDTGVLDTTDTAIDIGLQPVFRYECRRFSSFSPYLDLGAGVHFLSRANINGRQLGAAQQFSLIAGLGLSFKSGVEIGYRYMHLSNADIHDNNDGRDEHLGVITFLF